MFCSGVYITHNIHAIFIPNRKLHRTSVFFSSAWGSKKKHRKVRLQVTLDTMADPKIEEKLAPLRASVKEQVWYGVFVFFQVAYSWTKLIEINPDKIPETISQAVNIIIIIIPLFSIYPFTGTT